MIRSRMLAAALMVAAGPAAAQSDHTLDVEQRAVAFLAGTTLTPAERDAVAAAGRARHAADPAHDDAEVDMLGASLAPLPSASPADMARERETMMDLLAYRPTGPLDRPFVDIILRHNPILARDDVEQQVLTGRELDAYLDCFDPVADLLGVARLTVAMRAATAADLVARFATLDQDTRERLEDGEYRATVLRDWLARLTPAQIAAERARIVPGAPLADAVTALSDDAER